MKNKLESNLFWFPCLFLLWPLWAATRWLKRCMWLRSHELSTSSSGLFLLWEGWKVDFTRTQNQTAIKSDTWGLFSQQCFKRKHVCCLCNDRNRTFSKLPTLEWWKRFQWLWPPFVCTCATHTFLSSPSERKLLGYSLRIICNDRGVISFNFFAHRVCQITFPFSFIYYILLSFSNCKNNNMMHMNLCPWATAYQNKCLNSLNKRLQGRLWYRLELYLETVCWGHTIKLW